MQCNQILLNVALSAPSQIHCGFYEQSL